MVSKEDGAGGFKGGSGGVTMDGNSVHFSSASNEWSTPDDLFDKLNAEFHFTVDAAASVENAKCPKFWTYRENGLAQDWRNERVWCNPPYGREIGKWIEKAAMAGAEVAVLLIPARTDTKAWHQHIFGKAEVRFIQGRLKFSGGGKNPNNWNAPFPCAVIIWGQGCSVRISDRYLPLIFETV